MACPGKNYNISMILGPFTHMFIIEKVDFSDLFDFLGGANLIRIEIVNFGFWPKINFFA